MKKTALFFNLALIGLSLCLGSSSAMAKVSGSSRMNPAARDSSLLYNQIEMHEMGHGEDKNGETKNIHATAPLIKKPATSAPSELVTP